MLGGPLCGRMRSNTEMQSAPPVVRQHQEHVQDLEPVGRTSLKKSMEIMVFILVLEERPPGLQRRLAARQVLTHAYLDDVDAELEQLAMNPRPPQKGFSQLMLRICSRASGIESSPEVYV